MSIIATIKGWFSPSPSPAPRRPRLATGQRARATINDGGDYPFFSALYVMPPPDADTSWRTQKLDSKTLDRMSPARLLELLVNISPEVSRALFDFIRMFNPGWEILALRPGTEEQDARGQAALDDFFKQLDALYGSRDVTINRLILAGFMRGSFFAELALGEDERTAIDLVTPDPYSARFRKAEDPLRGAIYQLGQYQAGGWTDIDAPTVAYIPIDPLPNSPYGRALVAPAIFTSIFLIGLLHDLRRVVAQQGYPRLDLSIDLERLREAMPASLEGDAGAFENWVNDVIAEVQTVYGALEPDDAYIHTDVVQVNRPVGAVNADSLGAIDGLIMALERMATRALKTMPLLMGLDEGGSETHANRQWELHAAGIKAIQHLLEALLERLLTVALRAQGIQAEVKYRFSELRASEMLRDAQTEAMRIANEKAKYDNGWTSQDEASLAITGRPADAPGPRAQAAAPPEIVQGDGENEEVERVNGHH